MRPDEYSKQPMILSTSNAQFLLSRESWERALAVATLYDWPVDRPVSGADEMDSGDTPLTYLVAEDERVPVAEGSALADALERALPDIPDHDVRLEGGDVAAFSVYFSGIGKLWLRALAAFCRSGSFHIHSVSVAGESGEGYRAA